ncbi:MAG: hypothetical protein ACRCTI_09300, partial [Beijerinckiaceae bacterium]
QIDMGGARPKTAPARMPTSGNRLGRSPLVTAALGLVAGVAIAVGGAGFYLAGRGGETGKPTALTGLPVTDAQPGPAPMPGARPSAAEDLTPAKSFEKLARSGGLVKDPATAPELYHNARAHEARGDSANARRDYLAFAALGADHVDPLLRLAALIRAQDGRAGSREVFADLARGGSRAASLVHVLQFEGAERATRLAAFADANPDVAPAHALLAAELGEDRQNTQTIDERRRELAAIARFLAAERGGSLVPWFLDQSVLAQWIDRAQKREAALKMFFAERRDRVSAEFRRTNAGWLAVVALPEAATRLEYRLDGGGEFRPTGFLPAVDERTGKPMPNPSFEFPPQQATAEIALRYLDARGVPSAVTPVAFDPRTALLRGIRDDLERNATAWLAFGTGQNSQFLYHTFLARNRCAIEKVEIGFNGAPPTEALTLPPCDPANPFALTGSDRLYTTLRPAAQNVTIRLTYAGGDRSEIKTFPRPR